MTTLTHCSWCHTPNESTATTCACCGHDAQKPRMLCECPTCERPPMPINSDERCWMCGETYAAHDLDGGCP